MLLRLAFALVLLPFLAHAQPYDPDLAAPMIRALQAQVELQQAIMRKNEREHLAQMGAQAARLRVAARALRWATNPME